MFMDWAVRCFDFQKQSLPPFRDSPEGGMVLNEFTIRGDAAHVVLPNRCTDSFDTETVIIDVADLPKMDVATDKYWQYDAPGHLPRGAYLPSAEGRKTQGLARLLLDAPLGMYRTFLDGDALNCRRSNLVLLPHPPLQADWLWNAPLPEGFTLLRKLENSIIVQAGTGVDPMFMWQYLLERWQFCRSKGIHICVPRIHHERTSWTRRITVVVRCGSQTCAFDIGDNGAREWQQDETRETEMAA